MFEELAKLCYLSRCLPASSGTIASAAAAAGHPNIGSRRVAEVCVCAAGRRERERCNLQMVLYYGAMQMQFCFNYLDCNEKERKQMQQQWQ